MDTLTDAQMQDKGPLAKANADKAVLVEALERAERKLTAYVGVCKGDKELTGAMLPMCRAALARVKGGTQ